jgi:hypothetical protein
MSQWSQETRAKSLISRSSVVTQALMQNESSVGSEEYQKLQALESKAVAVGAAYEVARAAAQTAQAKRDEAERDLSALNSACLVICRVRGVAAALFEEFDKGDPVGMATHLETPVARIETIGPLLAEMLRHQRKAVTKAGAGIEPANTEVERASGELSSTLFQLEAGIASARGLLASKGVQVKFPTKPRAAKKAKPTTSEMPKATNPSPPPPRVTIPSNGASAHVEPSTEILDGAPIS